MFSETGGLSGPVTTSLLRIVTIVAVGEWGRIASPAAGVTAKIQQAERVPLMKLSAIRDRTAHDHKAASDGGIRHPRNADEAYALFCTGVREMKSRNDEAAFRIFDVLSRYK